MKPIMNHYPESTTMVAADRIVPELQLLVVDDSAIIRERLVRLLSTVPGLRIVGETGSVSEALQLIADRAPDIVTLDLRLVDGSGLEVLKGMERMEARPRVAVLSNYGDARTRRECLAMGADFFFDKSLQLGELRDTLIRLTSAGDSELPWEDPGIST